MLDSDEVEFLLDPTLDPTLEAALDVACDAGKEVPMNSNASVTLLKLYFLLPIELKSSLCESPGEVGYPRNTYVVFKFDTYKNINHNVLTKILLMLLCKLQGVFPI